MRPLRHGGGNRVVSMIAMHWIYVMTEPNVGRYRHAGFRPKSHPYDPDFVNFPFTWGICRHDLRARIGEGEWVFFLTGKNSPEGQRLVGGIRVNRVVTAALAAILFPKRRYDHACGNVATDKYGRHLTGEPHRDWRERAKTYVIGNRVDSFFCNDPRSPGPRADQAFLRRIFPEKCRARELEGGNIEVRTIIGRAHSLTDAQVSGILALVGRKVRRAAARLSPRF